MPLPWLLVSSLAIAIRLADAATDNPHAPSWYLNYVPTASRGFSSLYRHPNNTFRVYRSLWLHNEHFFAVSPVEDTAAFIKDLSANQELVVLPAANATEFVANMDGVWVPGNTLAIDFPFSAYSSNWGHWFEVLLPLVSMMYSGAWVRGDAGVSVHRPIIDNVFLPNLYRSELVDWAVKSLEIAMEPVRPINLVLPGVVDPDSVGAIPKHRWVGFENYITITDRYASEANLERGCGRLTPPPRCRSCLQIFRGRAWELSGLAAPDAEARPPRVITFMTANNAEQVVNQYEVIAMLWRVADQFGWTVRPYTTTAHVPFGNQVAAMAGTGLVVARHGPLLASATMLPPGAAVYELLPYNWEWNRISEMYRNMTAVLGDVHHFAWRPRSSKFAKYKEKLDERFAEWLPSECTRRSCLAAHAKAALIVDVPTVEEDLVGIIGSLEEQWRQPQDVFTAVSNMQRPWPHA